METFENKLNAFQIKEDVSQIEPCKVPKPSKKVKSEIEISKFHKIIILGITVLRSIWSAIGEQFSVYRKKRSHQVFVQDITLLLLFAGYMLIA